MLFFPLINVKVPTINEQEKFLWSVELSMKKVLEPRSLIFCLTMCCILWTKFHIKHGKLPTACFIISIFLLTLILAIFDDTFLTKYFKIRETLRQL